LIEAHQKTQGITIEILSVLTEFGTISN